MDVEYKIVGGDGAEYGPVPLDELKSWIHDGRVAGMTQVWRSDLVAWSPAERYAELRADLAQLMSRVARPSVLSTRAAGFWVRFAAYMVDHILLIMLTLAVWMPVAGHYHWVIPPLPTTFDEQSMRQFQQDFSVFANHVFPIYFPIFMVYDVLLVGTVGATFGKMLIGARIVRVDGMRLGYGGAFMRWAAARISDFFLFGGYLLIAFRPDKRAMHDLLAGTKVVLER